MGTGAVSAAIALPIGLNDRVTIDADGRVPWKEVINVMNLCKREQIDKIEFAFGAAAK